MDDLMDKEGYEIARLEGAGVDLYVPKGAIMVHANFKIFMSVPTKTKWGDGIEHNGMRRVYRRTEKTEDGRVIFVYNRDEDR